jgi:hypothetical protein
MNYNKIYLRFIEDRKRKESLALKGYFEKHHILPKALGGLNSKENLIYLTASDHLFAHKLLALIHGGSMWHALHMCHINESAARGVRLSRRWYEIVRKKRALHITTTRSGENHHFYGKKFSKKHRENLSISHIGKSMGRENSTHDPKFYDFRHKDGRYEKMLKCEFIKKHKIKATGVYSICGGSKKSYSGWYVSKEKIETDVLSGKGIHNFFVKKEKYNFIHDSGIVESCTQYELRKKYSNLNQSHISSICRGDRKSHKGWTVKK